MDFLVDGAWTLGLLVFIVMACTLFTNAVEWIGHRYNLSDGAVGSVLAAVGTALPETLVPIVALVGGALSLGGVTQQASQHIGVGAILGAPFLLSTLALFVSGVALFIYVGLKKRSHVMDLDMHHLRRDFQFFFVSYAVVLVASFITLVWVKWIIAVALVAYYGRYVYLTFTKEDTSVEAEEFELEGLYFNLRSASSPPTWLIYLQIFVGVGLIMGLAHLFVEEIHHLSAKFGIDALILSLLIIPIATELPEKFNSVVWIGKGKDSLALGNITGAMVFQSCIPTAIGIAFTPWHLDFQALLSVLLCFASSFTFFVFGLRKPESAGIFLLLGGAFYSIFLIYIFSHTMVGQVPPPIVP